MRWRALAVAIIASAVAGCGTQPVATGSPGPAAATASPSTSAAVPTVAPSPTAGPAVVVGVPSTDAPAPSGEVGLDWAKANLEPGFSGSALAHGPGGWIHLLSTDLDMPVLPDVAFSPDLRTWETVTPPGDVVVCGDGGSIAATSTTWLLRCGGLFRSADGRSWVQVPLPGSNDAADREVVHLVSDGRAFVGWRGNYPAETGIWSSADGDRWTPISLPGAPLVRVDAVIGRPIGGFLLAGRTAASAEDLREAHDMPWYSLPGAQAIWTSADGVTWEALPVGAAFDGGRITGLASDGPGGGVVAAGYRGENPEDNVRQEVAFWRSTDLQTWQRLEGVALAVLEDQVGEVRVIATAERWLVVGARSQQGAQGGLDVTPLGVTAGSEDGVAWWAVWPIDFDGHGPRDIVAGDGRLVALSTEGSFLEGEDSVVWVSPPFD